MAPTIRLAIAKDLAAIRQIYNHFVEFSTCTFRMAPETETEQESWFNERLPIHPVTVAEWQGGIIGWAALSQWKSRCAYALSAEFSVYVDPEFHRQGVGRSLVRDLINRAVIAGLHTIIGGACSEQVASIELQKSLGFEMVGEFREVGRKFNRWLNVVYMQLVIADNADLEG